MAATDLALRNALSKILKGNRDDLEGGRLHASSESPPAPPPSPQRSSDFEFDKLFHSPSSDYMESEPGSPSTSDCDPGLPCNPLPSTAGGCNSLAVPLCSNHHTHHHTCCHGNGLASCVCQISRQTEALSVSFPSDSCRHRCAPDYEDSSIPFDLSMSGEYSNSVCVEERLLESGLSQMEKRERKISLKRNHDDVSREDFCYADADPNSLGIPADSMAAMGHKKSCKYRSCMHGVNRSSPKHGRQQACLGSSVPCTSDFVHNSTHTSSNSTQATMATVSGSYPHWPNGLSRAMDPPGGLVEMSSAGVTARTTVGFEDQQMDYQDDDLRLPPVVTRVDDMECEDSLQQSSNSPFSFGTQVSAVSSVPVHPSRSQPLASFRPHAHTFSSGFSTCTNVSNLPSSSSPASGQVSGAVSHLGVPESNFATNPRTQQFDFLSFHEPSSGTLPMSPHDLFSKSL